MGRFGLREPWVETHGYHRAVATRREPASAVAARALTPGCPPVGASPEARGGLTGLPPHWNALGTGGRSRVGTNGNVRPAREASRGRKPAARAAARDILHYRCGWGPEERPAVTGSRRSVRASRGREALHQRNQLAAVHRFGKVAVHAGLQTSLAVAFHAVAVMAMIGTRGATGSVVCRAPAQRVGGPRCTPRHPRSGPVGRPTGDH